MPVVSATPNLDDLTLTITAEFAAPVDRVWQVYADPRQLEQIWGPPTFPATFVDFDFAPGGEARYYMTSPEGEKFGGWWKFTAIDPTSTIEFTDGFADNDLNPVEDMPVSTNVFEFTTIDAGTRAVYTSTYASADDLQKVLEMGVVEGASSAINQIDALLAA